MATGDVTLSLAIGGGVTKTVVLDSATRALARAYIAKQDREVDADVKWQVRMVNDLGNVILAQANSAAQAAASWTPKTFTAAT